MMNCSSGIQLCFYFHLIDVGLPSIIQASSHLQLTCPSLGRMLSIFANGFEESMHSRTSTSNKVSAVAGHSVRPLTARDKIRFWGDIGQIRNKMVIDQSTGNTSSLIGPISTIDFFFSGISVSLHQVDPLVNFYFAQSSETVFVTVVHTVIYIASYCVTMTRCLYMHDVCVDDTFDKHQP